MRRVKGGEEKAFDFCIGQAWEEFGGIKKGGELKSMRQKKNKLRTF